MLYCVSHNEIQLLETEYICSKKGFILILFCFEKYNMIIKSRIFCKKDGLNLICVCIVDNRGRGGHQDTPSWTVYPGLSAGTLMGRKIWTSPSLFSVTQSGAAVIWPCILSYNTIKRNSNTMIKYKEKKVPSAICICFKQRRSSLGLLISTSSLGSWWWSYHDMFPLTQISLPEARVGKHD